MTETEIPRITPDMAGCWLDGAMGWHNTYRVVDIAKNFGFTLSLQDDMIMQAFEKQETELALDDATLLDEASFCEAAREISNDATDYLQTLAPAGYSFQWDDGFYLWHDSECEGCEHDCAWRGMSRAFGAPFCSVCDDHAEAAPDDDA